MVKMHTSIMAKEQVYPGDNFDYHMIPFEGAFAAGTAQIMPYYGMPVGVTRDGEPMEEVGFSFNKYVITDLLRNHYGFDGVVCTDWKLLTAAMTPDGNVMVEAKCWGVEELSVAERAKKALDAGVDQFGGEACPEVVIELVESGQLDEARLDESARRILRDKFRLGLFDNPYVDTDEAVAIVGNDDFMAVGELAQRKSIVLLKNAETDNGLALPLRDTPKLYVENMNAEVAGRYGQVVETPDEADFAILRLETPYEPREGFLERFFHAGDLDFKGEAKERILSILDKVPTIVDIYLERAAVIPEIAEKSVGLIANFGANDAAILDVIFGNFNPTGKLPMEMPSSMEAVRNQREDMPSDSENPLFAFGYGLSYS